MHFGAADAAQAAFVTVVRFDWIVPRIDGKLLSLHSLIYGN